MIQHTLDLAATGLPNIKLELKSVRQMFSAAISMWKVGHRDVRQIFAQQFNQEMQHAWSAVRYTVLAHNRRKPILTLP